MKKGRQTRAQLDAEIEALIARKRQLAEEAAGTFTKALLRNEVKDLLADLSDAVIKQVARDIADMLPRIVDKVGQRMEKAAVERKLQGTESTDSVRGAVPNNDHDGSINA